ncbi:TPA: response regulator transcription factor [Clostridium botulinum]|uniref:response regulator transcription factor n=1 Tax=Clostridium TaxID=1485 RepID=UPI000D12C40F|nr:MULTISPECIES: response regulator transcription factor [Clostridium]AVQ45231.1 DNA-binding response regulator [Clostridium botulinum]AVQ48825.1 DNA-binding response regulator [Clostridium botulinum]MBD5637458.1 response regulator transcription factor [Clostridium botulinum]MBU5301427.1 response regulator transcription factor [Clostridium sporogenes]NFP92439.1 response regulator transcription factor [Clostridium sporogenes]
MATILIIEDDDTIAFGIKSFLLKNNYNVIHGENLKKGKELFTKDIDLILLDLNLPDGSGFDFCSYIKTIKDVPIIFLTVVDEESTMIKGLDMGGDDYITKPFKLSVLKSRITAVLRRTLKQNTEESVLCCKNIKVIKSESRVYKNSHEIELTVGEYNLLLQLLENKNRTLTRATLLKNLWDYNGEFVNNNTLSVAIKRLREKLEDDSCIKTVRGLGYRMED